MATAAQRIAAWSASLTLEDVPEAVAHAAKLHLLDTLGCGLAAHATGVAGEGRAAMAELGGEPHATVIGLERRLPAPNAAFANAMLCHGLDFDDTHSDSVSHVTTVTGPSALAAGEQLASPGRDVLAAIVAGNEVVCRIGMAASGEFHRRGFHPTAVCGVFGGTAAVARLGGLDAETTTRALGIAGSFASGLFAYLADGTPTKPMHPAWAAHGAHVAARLAAHGAVGPQSVLEGKFGLYHAFLGAAEGAIDIDAQLADLGSRWETPRIAYKPYPVCHFMHGSLGAAEAAAAGRLFAPDEIEDVLVTVPEAGVSLVLEPAELKREPRSEYEGKFSLQYSVASLLVRGHVDVGDFTDEAITDPGVLSVAARVRYETPDYPTYPQAFPGGIVVRLTDGSTLENDLLYQRGGPENPLADADVVRKYRTNAALVLPPDAVTALEEAVLALDERDDLRAALAPLSAREVATV
jgi:2-methylcitrate dehydratase PrpD